MECLCPSVRPLVSPRRKVWISYIQAYMPHESSEDSSTKLMVPWDPTDAPLDSLNDDTKILTETDTETFFRYQIFRNRNRYPQKIGKRFETEKFRNRNVNLCSQGGPTDLLDVKITKVKVETIHIYIIILV